MARILSDTVDIFVNLLYLLIVIRVVLSWIRFSRRNMFINLVYALTEPLLAPIRALLRKFPMGGLSMPLDLSPLVLFLIITLMKNIIKGFII